MMALTEFLKLQPLLELENMNTQLILALKVKARTNEGHVKVD